MCLSQEEGPEKPEEVVALFHLSRDFALKLLPLQAVKCLEAVVQKQPPYLPHVEAEARANLAVLLLRHTRNAREAKAHLERALRQAEQLPVSLAFVCKVISLLSTCLGKLGSGVQQRQVLAKGLDLVLRDRLEYEGATEEEKVRWYLVFQAHLAGVLVRDGEREVALEMALEARAEVENKATTLAQLQANLTVLQLMLAAGCHDERAADQVSRCEAAIGLCDATEVLESAAYFHLLRSLLELRVGRQDGLRSALSEAARAITGLMERGATARLLPPDFLEILYDLLASQYHRLGGDYAEEKSRIQQAHALIRKQSAMMGSDPRSAMMGSDPRSAEFEPYYQLLTFLVVESEVVSLLTRGMIREAMKCVLRLASLVDGSPDHLGPLEPSVHLLLGSLSTICGNFESAERILNVAMATASDDRSRDLAKLQLCLLELERGGQPAGDAADRVEEVRSTFAERDSAYPAALLCDVTLSERRGDTASAKRKVQEVIKTANEKGDRQVLALGLMEYARILMREGDTTLSKQVVDSAKGMATHVKHLPTLISALKVSDQGGILPAVLDKWDAMVGERGEVQRWVEALPIARDRLATS